MWKGSKLWKVLLLAGMLSSVALLSNNVSASTVQDTDIVINEVNFPDAYFRENYIRGFDTNQDGQLSKEECNEVTELNIDNSYWPENEAGIHVIEQDTLDVKGIACFQNINSVSLVYNAVLLNEKEITQLKKLKKLTVYADGWDQLTNIQSKSLEYLEIEADDKLTKKLNITHLPNLKVFHHEPYRKHQYRNTLNVSKNKKLEKLYCSRLGLKKLDVSKNKNLKVLYCKENDIRKLNVSQNKKLEILVTSDNKISQIKLSENITCLVVSKNKLKKISLVNCKKLEELFINDNLLKTIDLSNCKKLKELQISKNKLTEIDLDGCTNLESLEVDKNKLKELDVSRLRKIKDLICSFNLIKRLDLSNNKKIEYFVLYDNSLEYLVLPKLNFAYCNFIPDIGAANQIHTIDISSWKNVNNIRRERLTFWNEKKLDKRLFKRILKKSGKDANAIKKLVISKSLSKRDKSYVKKLAKQCGVKVKEV